MRLLLDTHVVIWFFNASPKLPNNIKHLITLVQNTSFIHAASLWEIAIKLSMGKLNLDIPFSNLLNEINNSSFKILQLNNSHLIELLNLPYIHKDPFDRLLISSALAENLTILTVDNNIQLYDVPWIW